MKIRMIYCITAAVIASVLTLSSADAASRKKSDKKKKGETEQVDTVKKETPYQKIFKDKKVETADGFIKMHLIDGKDLYFELPKTIIGRDILISSSVDRTSSGEEASAGFVSLRSVHVKFEATDSLVLLKEVDAYRYRSSDSTGEDAVRNSHSGAVVAVFPIKTLSPDSLSYVFDATKYITSHDSRLELVDPMGSGSFGGALSTSLNHKSGQSMLTGVEAHKDNVAVLSYETYAISKSFAGMSAGGGEDDNFFTVHQRKSLMLLPEQLARPRIADTRIGVRAVSKLTYNSDDRGSRRDWYVNRWNLDGDRKIVFHIDTLFPAKMAQAITKGVLAWNEAFEAMGKGQVIEVRPYPSDNPDFSATDLKNSCIRYEVIPSDEMRASRWVDPRSGEIISSRITIPSNILNTIHCRLLMEIGQADKDLRTVKHTAESIYDALQASITHQIGLSLGLDVNYVGSNVVPCDSLRSPSFTSRYGLSASIMDKLSANFFAREGDKEKGVCLVHTKIGAYDKYAVNWLYCDVPGAVTPEDEVPYLDALIKASKSDPMCHYLRRGTRADQRYYMDPRPVLDDLGDDPFTCLDVRTENFRNIMTQLESWIGLEDYDYSFRPNLNVQVFNNVVYPVMDMLKFVGGIYTNEKKEGDDVPSYEFVPASLQRKALIYLLDYVNDLSWLDECSQAWRDIIFVRSFADYIEGMLIPEFSGVIYKLAFAENKMDVPYSVADAYEDIVDYALKDVKAGRKSAADDLVFQYFTVSLLMRDSNINPKIGIAAAVDRMEEISAQAYAQNSRAWKEHGFVPMPVVDYQVRTVNDYRVYRKLLELKDAYRTASTTVKDESLRQHYRYIVMAIERALKIED